MLLTRFAAWLVAAVALALAVGMIYQSQGTLAESRAKLRTANESMSEVAEAKLALESMQHRKQFPTVPKSSAEEDRFLTGLRKHAQNAKATIAKYEASSQRYGTGADTPAVLAGLTRHTSLLVLEGSYSGLRTFLQSISASPRLYTFSDVRWSRMGDDCRLSMNLSRYVSPTDTVPRDRSR